MLNFEALAVIAGPAVLGVLVWLRARRGWSTPRVLFTGLFALYALKAVELTLFPIPMGDYMARTLSSGPFLRFLELVPLAGIVEEGALTPAFVSNVALGVPFGFGIWFLDTSMTARRALLAGAAASTTVEILQLAVGALVGFMYRVVDINDVIANTLGVGLGIAGFLVFAALLRRLSRALPDDPDGGLWTYLAQVVAAPPQPHPGPQRTAGRGGP